jgi:hypothetical protein
VPNSGAGRQSGPLIRPGQPKLEVLPELSEAKDLRNLRMGRVAEIEAQAEQIIKETETAKKKIDEDVYKEMIRLEALAMERVRLLVESSKAKLQLDLDAQNRLAHLEQRWRQEV